MQDKEQRKKIRSQNKEQKKNNPKNGEKNINTKIGIIKTIENKKKCNDSEYFILIKYIIKIRGIRY